MKKFIFIFFLLSLFSIGAFAQSVSDSTSKTAIVVPANFKSDGCSMFPDGGYRDCCVEHDKAYFNGGTRRQRRAADGLLFKCVAGQKGWWHRTFIAPMMWAGVRIGGVAFLPTSFRWGFGQKKSGKLSESQKEDVKKQIETSGLTEKQLPD